MKVEFTETAFKTLNKLDGSIQKQILKYAHELEGLKDPRTRGKGLSSNLAGLWRYRVGDWRLICEIKDASDNIHFLDRIRSKLFLYSKRIFSIHAMNRFYTGNRKFPITKRLVSIH